MNRPALDSPVTTGAPHALLDDAAALSDRRYVTAALMLVMTLVSMEMTVTSTAMPTIIGDLHGLEHYSWVASIYLLASTVTMPLYGRLADALGRKRVLLAAIALFTTGSLLASAAHSMTQLILCRGVQGLGAGGVMPLVLTILGDVFTLEARARVQAWFSAVWGLAALGGPALGALLVKTPGLGWRSIFFVNLPLGLLGLGVLVWKYHERQKPHRMDLDLPGVLWLATACTATLTLVTRAGLEGSPWWVTPALIGIAVAALVCFLHHERRVAHPIMPAAMLFRPQIGPSLAGSFLLGLGFLCVDTYVPLYIQGGRGGDATAAAGVVTPVMLTWALCNVVAAPLLIRWGFRKLALVGAGLIVTGFVGLTACAATGAPKWVLTAVLSITGLGFGPCSLSYLLAPQEAVEWHQRGGITSAVAFFRTMGGALGVGLLGALFNMLSSPGLAALESQGITAASVLDPESRAGLDVRAVAGAQHVIAHALVWVFAAMLALAVAQVLVTLMIPPKKPGQPVGRTEAFEGV